jgi:hypothetical protein
VASAKRAKVEAVTNARRAWVSDITVLLRG